jgi:hypothetical protein
VNKGGQMMGRLPILPKNSSHFENRQAYLTEKCLPVFYMSDYSVMGILVDKFKEAVRILEENKFSIIQSPSGIEVRIANAAHIQKIFQIFKKNSIDYGMADMVGQIYQG